jgi:ADP-ribosylglycohydrolase
MLLGLAIGDALGNTSEGMDPATRRRRYGEIRDYLPNWWADWRAVGLPSDDTQLAFWTIESLLRCGGLDPADLAESLAGGRIFGVGKTVTRFLMAYRVEGLPWYKAGTESAGNGALMRIAPVIMPHLRSASEGTSDGRPLWVDVIAATVLTHRDEAAVSASVGLVGLLMECLASAPARAAGDLDAAGLDVAGPGSAASHLAEWWAQTFLRYARPVETGRAYRRRGAGDGFHGTLCDLVQSEVLPAVAAGTSVLEAAERWRSGAYVLETVPVVLQILACHGDDPEEAIVRAVNDTWDNDTVAAVVGAAVGAFHGGNALPDRWRTRLLGRTREADDGCVQRLIEDAIAAYVR